MPFVVEQIYSTKPVETLYNIVYPDKNVEKFQWLYFDNPAGEADIFIIKDSDTNMVVGAYSFIPMQLHNKSNNLLVGQAIDGMVHPDYRNKHIFNRLVAEVFPIVTKKYDYLIGFPNNRSRGSLIRAGWIHLGNLQNYSFPMTNKALTSILPKNKILRRLGELAVALPLWAHKKYYSSKNRLSRTELKEVKSEQLEIQAIYAAIQKDNPVIFKRDSDFISWRLQTIPQKNYRHLIYFHNNSLQGFISYKSTKNSIEVVDFLVNPDKKHIKAALSLLISHAESEKVDSIHLQISEHAYFSASLRESGFLHRPGDNAVIVYPAQSSVQLPDWKDWYLSLADTDWL